MKEIAKELGWTIHPELEVFVSAEDVDDIMSGVLDYIWYWCSEAEVVGQYLGEYASEQISHGGVLKLHDIEEDAVYELNLEKMLTGIRKWLENEGDRYGSLFMDRSDSGEERIYRIDPCSIDGPMADEIVQYAIFGEIIYG